MTFEEIKDDIIIAEFALVDSKLDIAVKDLKLLCEVYCLTPFHWQSFYLRVYDGNEYTIQYVKPYTKDFRGLESVSTTFNEVLKAEAHVACEGKIFCGLKKVEKTNSTINNLLKCLPLQNEIHSNEGLMIDGINTLIINKNTTPETVLYFRSDEKFYANNFSAEDTVFLYNLHDELEMIIGNLRKKEKWHLTLRELYI